MGTPSTLTVATSNAVSGANHSHAITTDSTITTGTAVIMASDSNGRHRLMGLGVGASAAADDAVLLPNGGQVGVNSDVRLTFDTTNDELEVRKGDLVMYDDTNTAKLWIRRSGSVQNTEADILAQARMGLAAQMHLGLFIDANNDSSDAYLALFKDGEDFASATEIMQIDEGSNVTFAAATTLATTGGLDINGGLVVNEDSQSVNFRVEGNSDQYLLFCKASNDRVGIGESAPDTLLHLKNSTNPAIRIEESNSGNSRLLQMEVNTTNSEARITSSFGSSPAWPMVFLIGSGEVMRFDASGYIIPDLPTSAAGLPTGALWNDSGTVKVA